MKKIFKYIEPIWLDDKGKMSLRSMGALLLMIDFVINLHNSASIVTRVLTLIYKDKTVEPTLVAAMSGNLAQIAMMLGIEAGLIAALLALKTYQPVRVEAATSTTTFTNTTSIPEDTSKTTVTKTETLPTAEEPAE
jgi:hypothetical protein